MAGLVADILGLETEDEWTHGRGTTQRRTAAKHRPNGVLLRKHVCRARGIPNTSGETAIAISPAEASICFVMFDQSRESGDGRTAGRDSASRFAQ